jgi:hypothetical protein
LIVRPDPITIISIIYNSFCINKKGLASPSAYLGIIKKIDNFDEKKKAYIEENMKKAGL